MEQTLHALQITAIADAVNEARQQEQEAAQLAAESDYAAKLRDTEQRNASARARLENQARSVRVSLAEANLRRFRARLLEKAILTWSSFAVQARNAALEAGIAK